MGVERVDGAVVVNFQRFSIGTLARIGNKRGGFVGIAGAAGVKKVVIIVREIRLQDAWFPMVDVKQAFALRPLFPDETEDTTETELVAQPIAILPILRIPLRSMPSDMRLVRITEWIGRAHQIHLGSIEPSWLSNSS